MPERHDDYEPIIADRRSREPPSEEAQPLWRLVLALAGGVAIVGLLAWWWTSRPPSDSSDGSASTSAQSDDSLPEIRVEQEPIPPARDVEPSADIPAPPAPAAGDTGRASSGSGNEPAVDDREAARSADDSESAPPVEEEPAARSAEQVAGSESSPQSVTEEAPQEPAPPAQVSVRFTSPDPQVRVELRGPDQSSQTLTGRVGEVIDVAPGTYRAVASGAQLEPFEHEVTFVGGRLEYAVELCAERKYERESLAGRTVEERACASTEECQSMFTIMSEHAERLVMDRDFRTQECEKWRADAAPEGRWTLDTQCGGATLATTCRIQITEGGCSLAGPRRSARGTACPRADLR